MIQELVLNWPALVISVAYFWLTNDYFGWNFDPKSPEEVIADGIGFLILALAFI